VGLLSRWARLRPPAALAAQFRPDERLLALAESSDTVVAATNCGLWLPSGAQWRCVGWHEVVKAAWSSDGLTVVEGPIAESGLVSDRPAVVVPLDEPRNLPSVTRSRVEHSIARSEPVTVPGGIARLVARRVPGVDGIRWTARIDDSTPDSAQAREYLARRLADLAAADGVSS